MTVQDAATSHEVAGTGPNRRDRVLRIVQRQGAVVVLVLVVIVASVSFGNFASYGNARTILVNGSFPAIIALGMTFVILTGGIDLSVGSVYALGGVLAAYAASHGWGSLGAIGLPLLVCGAFGLLQGTLIARTSMAPFIVTLAGLLGARGLLQYITDEGSDTFLIKRDNLLSVLGDDWWPVLIAVVLFGLGLVLLHRTRFGQNVYAIGGSADAAKLMGVPVARTTTLVYVMSALLAGLSGALNAGRLDSGVTILGVGYELDAIAAVVIGGTLLSGGAGSLGGTLAGVLLLGVIQNIINQVGDLNSAYQQVVSGAFLAVVVVVQTYLARSRRLAA